MADVSCMTLSYIKENMLSEVCNYNAAVTEVYCIM